MNLTHFHKQKGAVHDYLGHTTRVTVAPCTLNGKALGPVIEAEARIVTDEQEILLAEVALTRKYGLTRRIYSLH